MAYWGINCSMQLFGLAVLLGHYRAISLHNFCHCFTNVLLPAVFSPHSKAVIQTQASVRTFTDSLCCRGVGIQIMKMLLFRITLSFFFWRMENKQAHFLYSWSFFFFFFMRLQPDNPLLQQGKVDEIQLHYRCQLQCYLLSFVPQNFPVAT